MNNLPHARGDLGRYSPHGASAVDGSELLHKVSLVVYPIIYDGFGIHQCPSEVKLAWLMNIHSTVDLSEIWRLPVDMVNIPVFFRFFLQPTRPVVGLGIFEP